MKPLRIVIPAVIVGVASLAAVAAFAAPRHGYDPGQFMMQLGKLHDQLQLSPDVDTAWKQAEADTRANFRRLREQGRGLHQQVRASFDSDSPDLRALSGEIDRFHAAREAARKSVRDEWLAVYDRLNLQQRQQVAQFMKDKLNHIEQMHSDLPNSGPETMDGN